MSTRVRQAGGAALAGLWLALSPLPALAQEPPAGFVWYVLDELNGVSFDIDDPTNRPALLTEPPSGVLMPVDVSRDGVPDWLIRWPQADPFCGTGGCRLTLYVSDGDGYRRMFDRRAWDPELRVVGDEVRLEASFHHLHCSPAREVCRLAWAWDPAAGRLSERPSSDGEAVISSFGDATVDLGDIDGRAVLPDDIPAAVLDRHLDGRRACGSPDDADVFTISWPAVASTPDLNGDGRRDWVIEPPAACADRPAPDYGYEVWVTDGTDGVARAFVAAPGRWPRFQVDRIPARLLDGPSCPEGNCATVVLDWDAAAGAFRSAAGSAR